MAGPVAWNATRLELGCDCVAGLAKRWVVVEFEQISALTVDTLVIV